MLSTILAVFSAFCLLLVILAFRKNMQLVGKIATQSQKITELENTIVKLKTNLQMSIEALQKADERNMDLKMQNTKVKFENKILKEKEEK